MISFTGAALLDVFSHLRPIPNVQWVTQAIDPVIDAPTGTDLDTLPFPQPSPFKNWGQYMGYKRKAGNFLVTDSFQFGHFRVSRIGHRSYCVDDGYMVHQITGQSDNTAFDDVVKFLGGETVKASTARLH
jgi:hypothetical protein